MAVNESTCFGWIRRELPWRSASKDDFGSSPLMSRNTTAKSLLSWWIRGGSMAGGAGFLATKVVRTAKGGEPRSSFRGRSSGRSGISRFLPSSTWNGCSRHSLTLQTHKLKWGLAPVQGSGLLASTCELDDPVKRLSYGTQGSRTRRKQIRCLLTRSKNSTYRQ